MAQFFIRRPIFAMVVSLLILIAGGGTLLTLPIEQYPALAPPTVRVETTYLGASAEVVEQSVATPIEQQVNGVDNMIYMRSMNTGDGRMLLDVTFKVGTDLDTANVLTQNRVSQAQSRLPQEVIQQGVTVKKLNPSVLMFASIYSPKETRDAQFLCNYAMINLRDALLRIQGVAQVDLIGGSEYGMRIWFDPNRMAKLGLTPADVVSAIKEQNLQAPAGQVGAAPSPPGTEFTYTVFAPGRFTTPEEFENILLRTDESGAQVRIKDIGHAELGSENYKSFGGLNGKPAAILAVYLLPGANQIDVAEGIYKTLDEQKRFFPPDVDYKIVYDTTPAVKASIEEILVTLYEAAVLVILVVFLFLQSVRATLVPLFAIPVSLVGTFLFFPLFGFSINTLSMFGLVLAIGTVVDDAIVVVEAVMHHIEKGMSPRDATKQAMKEVSGPVVGTALIMLAVFGPVAFMGGLTGMLYQQFAMTIACSVQISALVALSLSPALCVLLLKPGKGPGRGPLGLFFRGFNKVFDVSAKGYTKVAALLIRRSFLSIVLLGGVVFASGTLGKLLPKGFIPDEDQGIFLANIQLPNAASLERSRAVCEQVEEIIGKAPAVEAYNTMGGLAFLTNSFSSNVGSAAVGLKDWGERPETPLPVVIEHLQREFAKIPEAVVFPFAPPTIPGFGAAGGFTFILQDRSGTLSVEQLTEYTSKFLEAARKRPELRNLFTAFDARVPQRRIDLDREKARKQGVPINDVFLALQSVLGGTYVNDFNRFGRLYRVYIQAAPTYRQKAEDIGSVYVRSKTTGDMVPLSTLVDVKSVSGAELTVRFNMFRSVEVSGSAAPGYSSAQAMAALEETARAVLPSEMGFDYSGLSYQEKIQPPVLPILVMGAVCIFLLLAAMYESWALPWSVLLTTPLVILGSFFGVWLGGFDNNVFVQVGVLMLIGLAAKTAILIVEFAKMKREQGATPFQAAVEAAELRFRPILMTAFTFVLGVVPLMIATGSGANSRQVMGTSVFWGMICFVVLGLFLTPALYELIERLASLFRGKKPAAAAGEAAPPASEKGDTDHA